MTVDLASIFTHQISIKDFQKKRNFKWIPQYKTYASTLRVKDFFVR
jgi:hypothetical protein